MVMAALIASAASPVPSPAVRPAAATQSDQAAGGPLVAAMAKITKSATPTLADWQKLVDSKPKGVDFKKVCPMGPGNFVMALCQDPQNRVYVGTEGDGLWRFDSTLPLTEQWKHFTRASTGGPPETNGATIESGNFLGDDYIYALTCDNLGRIWAGHLNHGVSVFNGQSWKNYNVLEGPLGERLFAITTCPTDGDIWMATSSGLARYSLKKDTWSYFTRAEGLSSDQANTIAFAKDGTLFLGTQCDGINIADAKDDYKTWRAVHASKSFQDRVPFVPKGDGLPTDLINQIIVAKDGTVYAATTTGLAWSKTNGASWHFVRGRDWVAKVKGQYGGTPKGWTEPKDTPGILPEDFVTTLAEGDANTLYIGTRKEGYALLTPAMLNAGAALADNATTKDHLFISVILPPMNTLSSPIFGLYDGGLVAIGTKASSSKPAAATQPALPIAALPHGAGVLSDTDQKKFAARLTATSPQKTEDKGWITLDQDWTTQGQWLGRYGRNGAVLCAFLRPQDYVAGLHPPVYRRYIGAHCNPDDSLRHWITWEYTTDARSLEFPVTALETFVNEGSTTWQQNRRQADWDDHGEVYADSFDGPHIYCDIHVETAPQIVSLYFVNKDGHTGPTRYRDYLLRILPGVKPSDFSSRTASANEEARLRSQSPLVSVRIQNFWNGYYSRFLVTKPGWYTVEVNRNYSLNATLAGIFLDPLLASNDSNVPHPDKSQSTVPTEDIDPLLLIEPAKPKTFLDSDLFSLAVYSMPSAPRREVIMKAVRLEYGSQSYDARTQLQEAAYQLHLFPLWEAGVETNQHLRTDRQHELIRDHLRGLNWMNIQQVTEHEQQAEKFFLKESP